jgi:uncharacterized metal-binding protein YceD (DUF177 family)
VTAVFSGIPVVSAEEPLLPTREFSRRQVVEPWPDAGIDVLVIAEPAERQALARRFDLLEVTSLRGQGRLERSGGRGELVLQGWLEADVVQACVISLEPVPAAIRQPIRRRYLPAGGDDPTRAGNQPTAVVDLDDDEAEALTGRAIDLGEVFAEELGLALDPYPRAPGATTIEAELLGPHVRVGEAESSTPFAALRRLQEKHAR